MIDNQNPKYLFSTIDRTLLVKIVNKEINPRYLAGIELASRGLDMKGLWVGFDEAKKIHKKSHLYMGEIK